MDTNDQILKFVAGLPAPLRRNIGEVMWTIETGEINLNEDPQALAEADIVGSTDRLARIGKAIKWIGYLDFFFTRPDAPSTADMMKLADEIEAKIGTETSLRGVLSQQDERNAEFAAARTEWAALREHNLSWATMNEAFVSMRVASLTEPPAR